MTMANFTEIILFYGRTILVSELFEFAQIVVANVVSVLLARVIESSESMTN